MLDWFFKGNKQIDSASDRKTWTYQLGEHSITITKKPRMKRILLSVKKDGSLRVSAPLRVSLKDIYTFIEEQRPWIETTLKKVNERRKHEPQFHFSSGEQIHFRGCPFVLDVNWKQAFDSDELTPVGLKMSFASMAPFDELSARKAVQARLQRFYQTRAVQFLPQRMAFWSEKTGWPYRSLKIKNLRSMWGSCTNQKDIYLSWRLMVFDEAIIDYVIIHELAHTQHMNHSARFWKCVEEFCPEYKHIQKRIRAQQVYADFLLAQKS